MAAAHDMSDAREEIVDDATETRVELVEERAVVDKRTVERVGARIHLRTSEEEVPYTETLRKERVTVERKPLDTLLDVPPETRMEGDTMIVPVVEEVLVKRYRVIEELHIASTTETVEVADTVVLRRQEAIVDDTPGPATPIDPAD